MEFKENIIKLSSIEQEDKTYRITTKRRIEDLADSIKDFGLINPPLFKRKESKYIIISGFRRVKACKYLGWPDIKARILISGAEEIDCVNLAIADNSFQRHLDLIEQSRSLNMLYTFYNDYSCLSGAAKKLGLPANPSIIEKVLKICHLPETVQDGILSERISLSMAEELSGFDDETGIFFAGLFKEFKLSLNKQKEIITLIKEIALREGIPLMQFLRENDIQKILNNKDLDRVSKTKKIRYYLKKRRFPVIARTEKKFSENMKELNFKNSVHLLPPNNFEGNTYILKLQIKNLKELKNHIELLQKNLTNPALKKILET